MKMRRPNQQGLYDEMIVDNFAGGGGASTGIEAATGRPIDIAINHDPEAIAMHEANHPFTTHYTENVFDVDPRDAARGRKVGLAWFSPDCKHFRKAKGGKPVEKKIRGLAWVVKRWAATVKPRVIMLENVEGFQTWGPLIPKTDEKGAIVKDKDGQPVMVPCPARKGLTFHRWVKELKKLGYAVEWKELVACDYGAPTTRKRLFLVARCDGQPIVWPKATHGPGLKPYRTAAECIDWSIPCPSIFERKRPLADNILRRIAKGANLMDRFFCCFLGMFTLFFLSITDLYALDLYIGQDAARSENRIQLELLNMTPHETKVEKNKLRNEKLALLGIMSIVDYNQSVQMFYHDEGKDELNPILGKEPSRKSLLAFGTVALGLTYLLSDALPPKWSTIFLDSVIESERLNIRENYEVINGRSRRFDTILVVVKGVF